MKTSMKDKVLIRTREILARPYGWTKNQSARPDARAGFAYCLSGAHIQATEDLGAPLTDRRDAWKAIKDATPPGHDPISFNDKKTTRKKDVLALIDKALAS